ncbi:hypothetical protein [Photobacterium carnosum]|uniref:hypothetical protein n=1 Tax=Photobacterium carnosum TaxID=2023717 RepID=UPI001E34AE10|nr:hypothetical protein [Photobacterium carnosum]
MLSLSPLRASGASNYYLEEEKQFHINQPEFTITSDNLEHSDKESSLQPTENPTAITTLLKKVVNKQPNGTARSLKKKAY